MVDPEITVIVLAYNQEVTIARTLESILTQRDCPPYEILIGEDGSTDKTLAICREFSLRFPERIRIMPSAPNKGLVRNYCDCFFAAKGRFIGDCSGDDYWIDPYKLHKEYHILSTRKDISIVFSGIVGKPAEYEGVVSGKTLLSRYLDEIEVPEIVLSASLYRSKLVSEEVKNMGARYPVEDYPIVACLLASGDAYSLKGECLAYDSNGESVSRPKSEIKRAWNAIESLKMRLDLAGRYGIERSDLNRYVAAVMNYIAAIAYKYHSKELSDELESLGSSGLKLPLKAKLYRLLSGRWTNKTTVEN